jgi:ribosome maturation factor RimP
MFKSVEIENLLLPAAVKDNMEIVDVQYVKENGDWILRVFIDKSGGVTIDDCEKASRSFSVVLDGSDMLKDSYILEVSSPGINRILKKESDFERFIGSKARIQTFNPINNQKNFLGVIAAFKDGEVVVDDATSGFVKIDFLDIKKANLAEDI